MRWFLFWETLMGLKIAYLLVLLLFGFLFWETFDFRVFDLIVVLGDFGVFFWGCYPCFIARKSELFRREAELSLNFDFFLVYSQKHLNLT